MVALLLFVVSPLLFAQEPVLIFGKELLPLSEQLQDFSTRVVGEGENVCNAVAVAAGEQQANRVLTGCPTAKLVVTHISRVALIRLRKKFGENRVTGVYLEQPPASQLRLLRTAMPLARNVAVLFSEASEKQFQEISEVAPRIGLTLVPILIPKDVPPVRALQEAFGTFESVLVLADPDILTPVTIRPLLLGTARRFIPMFGGLSTKYVDAGLAGGVFAADRGIAQSVSRLLHDIQSTPFPAPVYAQLYRIEINPSVTRLLNLNLEPSILLQGNGSEREFPDHETKKP